MRKIKNPADLKGKEKKKKAVNVFSQCCECSLELQDPAGLDCRSFFFLPVSLRANSVASGVTGDHRIVT